MTLKHGTEPVCVGRYGPSQRGVPRTSLAELECTDGVGPTRKTAPWPSPTHWFRYGRGGGEMLTMTSGEGAVRVLHGCGSQRVTGKSRSAQVHRHRREPWAALPTPAALTSGRIAGPGRRLNVHDTLLHRKATDASTLHPIFSSRAEVRFHRRGRCVPASLSRSLLASSRWIR